MPEYSRAAPASSRLDPAIFREYDIRGVVGENVDAEIAGRIARAFAMCLTGENAPVICLGRDGRKSSPTLAEAMKRALCESGVQVVDIGIGPTPMLYFAAHTLKAAGAIMITGSHNPPDHNGFKFVLHGKPFYGAQIQELRKNMEAGVFSTGQGKEETRDVSESYLSTLIAAYDGARNLKVAWDAGNGAAGDIMAALAGRLPGTHVLLNEKIDGRFPAHHPDPSVPDNLQQLIETVRGKGLDCGIAFDGDGDRIGVVDDKGGILWGDQLLMLFAADVLADKPGATIIADVKASGALFDEITRLGGKPLMWKTGHSHIKAKMAETNAIFAGEVSGHVFFADKYFGYDDALYAAVRLLALLARSGKKLSELQKNLPRRFNTPEIRFFCDDARKFVVIDEVKSRLRRSGAEFSDIDGVRVTVAKGWWLLRASNTQPMLVARCEAVEEGGLARLKEDLRGQLAASNVCLP